MHQSRHAEHCTLRAHRSVVCWQWVAGRAPKPDSCIALLFFNTKKPLHIQSGSVLRKTTSEFLGGEPPGWRPYRHGSHPSGVRTARDSAAAPAFSAAY